MVITREMTPSDFLRNHAWECDNLIEALDKSDVSDETFDQVVEDMFPDGTDWTGLNDYFRFEWESICSALGIPTGDEEPEDDEDEE